jgi:hypothetical protein
VKAIDIMTTKVSMMSPDHRVRHAAEIILAIAEGVRGTVCAVGQVELAPDRASPAISAAGANNVPESGR